MRVPKSRVFIQLRSLISQGYGGNCHAEVDFTKIGKRVGTFIYFGAALMQEGLQSVTKIMRKAAIREILCFSPLPPLNNVEKQ